jgi:hypothetical protein
MVDGVVKYESKTVTVIRGTEARSVSKWEKQGWEFVSQSEQPLLRTKLKFRRAKAKPPWRLLAGVAGILVALGISITVMSLIENDSGTTANPVAPSNSTEALATPQPTESPAEPYVYDGPKYEIVAVDEDQSPATLVQYWIYSTALDESADTSRAQVKTILSDVARSQGSKLFLAEVVNDREIALAESPSTYQAFIDTHGLDYAQSTIPEKEREGWIASYAGGFDYDTGESSESAFEIVWWPSAAAEVETWQPEAAD